jgi:hypothetical protein
MKNIAKVDPATPFGKFKQLTERLIAVPKKELDEKLKENEQKKKRMRRKKQG